VATSSNDNPEHVVQHERRPLGRRQPLQHHDKRIADVLVQRDPVLRIVVPVVGSGEQRREVVRQGVADDDPAPARRAQLIETAPAHGDDEPSSYIVDAVDVLPRQTRERFLDDVFGLGDAAEHPEGQVEHVAPVRGPGGVDVHVARTGQQRRL